MQNSILFLTLKTFSLTGGIEKVCRCFCKVLQDLNCNFTTYTLADSSQQIDEKYLSKKNFKGFNNNKLNFTFRALFKGLSYEIIILSHINLLLIAYLIKIIKPSTRIIIFAHGIEIWRDLPSWKKRFLRNNVELWAVSKYTAKIIQEKHQVSLEKISILNNCLDPYINLPEKLEKPYHLLKRYNLNTEQPILFTLSRLSSTELYKGYDIIIKSMPNLLIKYPNIKYLIAGKADDCEKNRLNNLIKNLNLEDKVLLTGFIPEHELTNHFLLADLFVMPSKYEGFGIVFIEAAACGCKIIGGNADGSTDALLNGKLGKLIDPNNNVEIEDAIISSIDSQINDIEKINLQNICLENFSFKIYKDKVAVLLGANNIINLIN